MREVPPNERLDPAVAVVLLVGRGGALTGNRHDAVEDLDLDVSLGEAGQVDVHEVKILKLDHIERGYEAACANQRGDRAGAVEEGVEETAEKSPLWIGEIERFWLRTIDMVWPPSKTLKDT